MYYLKTFHRINLSAKKLTWFNNLAFLDHVVDIGGERGIMKWRHHNTWMSHLDIHYSIVEKFLPFPCLFGGIVAKVL